MAGNIDLAPLPAAHPGVAGNVGNGEVVAADIGLARQLLVQDYADDFTRRSLEKEKVRCCAVVSQAGIPQLGSAWARLNEAGLRLVKLKTVNFT